MAVRNFWVEATIDGRKTKVGTGPKSSDGGMRVKIFQRDRGNIIEVVDIDCIALQDGRLVSDIEFEDKTAVDAITTFRDSPPQRTKRDRKAYNLERLAQQFRLLSLMIDECKDIPKEVIKSMSDVLLNKLI